MEGQGLQAAPHTDQWLLQEGVFGSFFRRQQEPYWGLLQAVLRSDFQPDLKAMGAEYCGCLRCHKKSAGAKKAPEKDHEKEEQDAGSHFTQMTLKRESPDMTPRKVSQDSPFCLKYK